MRTTELFSEKAASYATARPGYPEALLDFLDRELHFASSPKIADIGSGTGILTAQLLTRGAEVFAVEPNADMRSQSVLQLGTRPGFHPTGGSAEHTNLPDRCVHAVTAAQAFHWFDTEAFREEALRILQPGGSVYLIWNIREDDAPITAESFEIFRKYCPRFKGSNNGMSEDDPRIHAFFREQFTRKSVANPLYYDEAKYLSRHYSSSYALKPGEDGFEECTAELRALFRRHAGADGRVCVPNRTNIYYGRLSHSREPL